MRKIALLAVVVLLIMVFASAGFALVKKMDTNELHAASTDVIVGKVASSESRAEDGLIYTYFKVKIKDRIKGTPPEFVTVRVPGGEAGEMILFVSDTPEMTVGEDVVLFLKAADGFHEVTGWYQGKYTVSDGVVGEADLPVDQFKDHILQGKPAKPAPGGYKKCGYDWTYLGMSGGKYHSEPWEINAANNDGISSGSVNSAVQAGASVWGGAGACFAFGASSTGSSRTGPAADDHNVVCFGNTGGAVAGTYIWVLRSCRKCIAEVDLVFDHVYWDFGVNVCGSTTKFDLQNVAAHEFGHWLCLGDLYGSGDYNQTMYGYVDFGECYKKDLYTGDIAGAKAIYGTCATALAVVPEDQIADPEAVGTKIDFAVPVAGQGAVQIFNVRGQLVRTVSDGYLDAGKHSATWDGRDASGNGVAPGVYFVRVSGEGYARSTKLMYVK